MRHRLAILLAAALLAFASPTPAPAQTRALATGLLSYCVDAATGSDLNTGVSPNCRKTLASMASFICGTLDLGGFGAQIWVRGRTAERDAAGNPQPFVPCDYVGGYWDAAPIVVIGTPGTAAEIYAASGNAVVGALNPRPWVFKSIGFTAPAGVAVESDNGSKLVLDGPWFGPALIHMQAILDGGILVANSDYTITGSAQTHMYAQGGGQIVVQPGHQVFVPGSIAWSQQFAYSSETGMIRLNGLSFNVAPGASVTGKQYTVDNGGGLSLGGAGIAGTVYGTVTPPGWVN